MQLLSSEFSSADLTNVQQVFVHVGPVNDPGVTVLRALKIKDSKFSSVGSPYEKASFSSVERADDEALEIIRGKLLSNPTLARDKATINSGKWLTHKIEITDA
ncbi:hypothetical protein [Pseudomonas viridiflava]|uniref:hypothetical protein n=1 Tax=Pseudomonas viridiflava TaxID=33069 RepID=UPI000F032EF4|nr:hypothetical protein [Pseudomonas viridiflava]